MIANELPPSVVERYLVSVGSGTCRDIVAAAGMARSAVGLDILRTQAEFDVIRRGLEQSCAVVPSDSAESASDMIMARFEVLSRMHTLDGTRQKVMSMADGVVKRRGMDINPSTRKALVCKVIDVYLDDKCHSCRGTGVFGSAYHSHGARPMQCRACGGSAHRRDAIGANDVQRAFASEVLALMQQEVAVAAASIRRHLVDAMA